MSFFDKPAKSARLIALDRADSLHGMYSLSQYLCWLCLGVGLPVLARDYHFDGSMSEEVLRSYLSRSMTTIYLLTGHGNFDDNLRMLTNCGVTSAGGAVYCVFHKTRSNSALRH